MVRYCETKQNIVLAEKLFCMGSKQSTSPISQNTRTKVKVDLQIIVAQCQTLICFTLRIKGPNSFLRIVWPLNIFFLTHAKVQIVKKVYCLYHILTLHNSGTGFRPLILYGSICLTDFLYVFLFF